MFGENLRRLRREQKWTQSELGQKLNVSATAIALWENGKREPNINTINQLANIFNVSTNYLLNTNKETNTVLTFGSDNPNAKYILGNNLRRLRREQKWTQSELGQKLNVSPVTIARWETGQREPDIETINNIAKIFNVSSDYLMGREEPPITVAPKKMVARTFSPEQMKVLEELLQAIKDENDNNKNS